MLFCCLYCLNNLAHIENPPKKQKNRQHGARAPGDGAAGVPTGGLALRMLTTLTLLSTTADAACESSMDCSLNGECEAGRCVCDPGWGGSADCACSSHLEYCSYTSS